MSPQSCFLVSVVCLVGISAARGMQLIEKETANLKSIDWIEIKKAIRVQSESARGMGCNCVGYHCGCCVHLSVPKVKLDDTVCANVTYLPSPEYGISVTLSLNGAILFNYTVSVRNPPPLCVGIPKLTKYAGICLVFYNVTFSGSSLSACVRLRVKLDGLVLDKIELGCFKIPPGQKQLDGTVL